MALGKRQEARGKSEEGLGDFTFRYILLFEKPLRVYGFFRSPTYLGDFLFSSLLLMYQINFLFFALYEYFFACEKSGSPVRISVPQGIRECVEYVTSASVILLA